MTANRISGIHHITAIASDPQKNLDFYAGLLGLRFVKRTVNFDDPGSYHFYFGDAAGSPGTILTFFPWPDARRGVSGSGSVTATAFAVPVGSLPAWRTHLQAAGVRDLTASTRFGQAVLSLSDPDGMGVELIETPGALDLPVAGSGWPGPGPQIPDAIAIRGFHSATITVRKPGPTAEMLTTHLGMTETTPSTPPTSPDAPRRRFAGSAAPAAADGTPFIPGAFIDLLEQPDAPPTHLGAGVVHHIAVRAATDAQQGAFQSALRTAGFNVTPVQDRSYFRSIYYRERAGVLFEIATDGPGFAIDESPASLGMGLMLPPRYESAREQIRAHVLPVRIPTPAHPALGTHVHRWIPHPDAKPESTQTLLLLHGTGGDENDLLSLGRKVAPAASLLSPRGNVLEGQAPRFFRRIREGVFDMADLARRTAELRDWLAAASGAYGLTPSALTAVGFSNGANTAGALLLTPGNGLLSQPDTQPDGQPSTPPFTRAVLLRAMTTVRPDRLPNLKGVQVLLISGKDDPIVPLADANTLAGQLRAAGADVQHEVLPAGHNLTGDDLTLTRAFLQQPTPVLPPSPQPALSR